MIRPAYHLCPSLTLCLVIISWTFAHCVSHSSAQEQSTSWKAGLAKIDVTPSDPVRLSGYGNRDKPSEGIATRLHVRSLALQHSDGPVHVMVSIDSIGLPGEMTSNIATVLKEQSGLAREQIVFCNSHTHSGPDLFANLSNIFATPLSTIEQQNAIKYREQLQASIIDVVKQAIAAMRPVTLAHAQGAAGFAANRRLVKDAKWTGFGVQSGAPVDHSVPLLCLKDVAGKVVGLVFNYACHCTTLDGNYYQVNSDWAGIASDTLEKEFDGAVALCTIGCGGDANPEPRGTAEQAAAHGATMAAEVKRLVAAPMKSISSNVDAHFGYAGLSFDLPSKSELEERAKSTTPQTQRNALHLLEVLKENGRLPATYPVPVQTWKFGKELTMIFIGGEVVVDYALRLKKELADPNLWVTAYSNDVLGYICSQRMRAEGGYEFRDSCVYYNLPGPWASGTEDLLIQRIKETLNAPKQAGALSPQEGLHSIVVPDDLEVQLVAAEPLVADPINIAFGPDGKLWVVEMGDYPNGGADGKPLGKIKYLSDTDGDGQFDAATTFLDDIAFATGVHPWKDGVIVTAAPEVFFARDTDGDGVADERRTLYSGFELSNPQHRVNGFAYGLDHSLLLAAGDNLGDILCHMTGETINASGCDLKIYPNTGELELVSGRTQFIRSRDDWGNWFGNDNSRPMYHYPIEERYIRRVPTLKINDNMQQMFDPPIAPPVYPISATPDRFNDLFAHNRFTSACSAIIFNSPMLGSQRRGSAFVCEPVHNLVHNAKIERIDSTFKATRFPGEEQKEFLASSDPWFRPVRAVNGPDGMLWVVDMYRLVIEHPEWIPAAWQDQLDLRAGADRGRIYRVIPKSLADDRAKKPASALPVITDLSSTELVQFFESDYGALRDLAQQELLNRASRNDAAAALEKMLKHSSSSRARLHALWSLDGMDALDTGMLASTLTDKREPQVQRNALIIAEGIIDTDELRIPIVRLLSSTDSDLVVLQLALTIGEWKAENQEVRDVCASQLKKALSADHEDKWLQEAVLTSATGYADTLLEVFLDKAMNQPRHYVMRDLSVIADLIELDSIHHNRVIELILNALKSNNSDPARNFALIAVVLEENLVDLQHADASPLVTEIQRCYQSACSTLSDKSQEPFRNRRIDAISLLGRGLGDSATEQSQLIGLIAPQEPSEVQLAAASQLCNRFDAPALDAIIEHWPTFTQQIRENVIAHMLRSGARASVLLDKIEAGKISRMDLTAADQQRLLQMGDQSIRVRASRLLVTEGSSDRRKIVQDFLDHVVASGDRANGEVLFKKLCSGCHTPDQAGRSAGPNLSNLTDRSSPVLLTAILDPNRAVDPQYRNYLVLTSSGETYSGAIAQEIGNTITLAQTNGKFVSLQRSDIEEMKNTGLSIMPEGLERELNHQQASDLLEYLRQPIAR